MTRRLPLALAALLAACSGAPPRPPPPPRVNPAALLAEAVSAREAGDVARARARLEEAVAADPVWDLPRLELADLLLAEGAEGTEVARAEALLAPPAREDNPRLWRLRGAARDLAGDDAGAADHFGRALALRDDVDLRFRRALLLDRLERLDEAAAELERVRARRPNDPAPIARLADVYERLGRVADAERLLLAEAYAARPGAWLRLSRFYGRNGQPEKAAEAERRAKEAVAPARQLRPLGPSRR